MTDLVERLRNRKVSRLKDDWDEGKHCPECGVLVKKDGKSRMNCADGLGGWCKAFEHENYDYDPSMWIVDPDPECSAAADRIEELEAENTRLREALSDVLESLKKLNAPNRC